jgi:hypothetical protein
MRPRHLALTFCVSIGLLFTAGPAAAQLGEPPGPFVVDVRAALSTVGRSEELALPRGLRLSELPRQIRGLDVGGHIYPVRGKVTLGIGAHLLRVGATQTPGEPEGTPGPDTPITPGRLQVTGVVPQLSLNFGTNRGWSYVGAGAGFSRLEAGRAEADLAASPALLTLNLGGGARWFVSERVAFTFDVRFYKVGAKELAGDYIGNPAISMFVIGAGLSFQ